MSIKRKRLVETRSELSSLSKVRPPNLGLSLIAFMGNMVSIDTISPIAGLGKHCLLARVNPPKNEYR